MVCEPFFKVGGIASVELVVFETPENVDAVFETRLPLLSFPGLEPRPTVARNRRP